MAETMKDYEAELEASFKKIEEGDILLSVNGMRGTGAQQAEQRQQETHHL